MNRSYNNALVLLRLLAVGCIAWGLMGFVFTGVALVIGVSGAPRWFIENVLPYAATGVLSSPLYVLLGATLLALSRRLATFLAKFSKPETSERE